MERTVTRPQCRFCKRWITDELYTRVKFPDGIALVCDDCNDKADDPDVVEWRGAEVEVS